MSLDRSPLCPSQKSMGLNWNKFDVTIVFVPTLSISQVAFKNVTVVVIQDLIYIRVRSGSLVSKESKNRRLN